MKHFQVLASALAVQSVSALQLTVSTDGGNASSPLLYGLMIEDINHSIDGGLHGQELRNNGFQGDNPGLTAYAAVGSADISQDTLNPLSGSILASLSIKPQQGATGAVGVSNEGYFGIRIPYDDTYANYFFVKGDYSGPVTVSLVGNNTGTVYGSTDVNIASNAQSFTYYQTQINAKASTNEPNVWHFTFDASSVPNGLNLGLPQLYPTTFKQRFNGLKPEIANTVNDLKGSFLRFPGGNNLEGYSIDNRWKWNETIGKLEDRPGRQGTWSYPNTDALGLLEYLYWAQDMNLTPILAVWAGLTLSGDQVTGDALQPFIDDILNELEYVLGDASTTYGAQRAADGQQDPFDVQYIEIGNEDFLNNGQQSYQERFDRIRSAILAVYPNMNIISSIAPQDGQSISTPEGTILDVHIYAPPDQFVSLFNDFDNVDRSYPIFVGEYGSTTHNDGSTQYFSTVQSAVSEGVYAIGLERNSDIVKMACFAPMIERFESAQWHPNLFGYDSTHGVTRSVSYYVQKLLSTNRGDTILPVTADAGFGPVYWVASSTSTTTFVKLANYGDSEQSVTVQIPNTSSAQFTTLSGDPDTSNLPGNEVVVPVTTQVTGSGSFDITLPAWSFAVLAAS